MADNGDNWTVERAYFTSGLRADVAIADADDLGRVLEAEMPDRSRQAEPVILINGERNIEEVRDQIPAPDDETVLICVVASNAFSLEMFAELYGVGVRVFFTLPLTGGELEAAIAKGRAQELYVSDQLTSRLLTGAHGATDKIAMTKLSDREREVLRLLLKGMNTKAIARLLNVSFRTVEAHRLSIRKKTGVSNYAQLAIFL